MKNYPVKPKKRKPKLVTDKFDKSKLSTFDLNLLDAFHERREKYEHLIKESTIIYHKRCVLVVDTLHLRTMIFLPHVLSAYRKDALQKRMTPLEMPQITPRLLNTELT